LLGIPADAPARKNLNEIIVGPSGTQSLGTGLRSFLASAKPMRCPCL
jgi:hypothetical protein